MFEEEKLKKEAEELYKDWYAHKLGAISIIDVICKMAEPREKRIAELEENLKLWTDTKDARETIFFQQKRKIVELEEANIELQKAVQQREQRGVEVQEDLLKEITELKRRVDNQKSFLERIRAKFELGEIERKEIEGYLESDQLTKAKELLKHWVNSYGGMDIYLCKKSQNFIEGTEE